MKTCTLCRETRSTSEFPRRTRSRDGLDSWCKHCHKEKLRKWKEANREKVMERNRRRAAALRERDPEKVRAVQRKCLYGISREDYEEMVASQDGKCAICRLAPSKRNLSVDHCHESQAIRGLLCDRCNLGMGMFKDSASLLQAAIDYLNDKTPEQSTSGERP